MVEDDVLVATGTDGIGLRMGLIAQTDANMANNYFVGIDCKWITSKTDAIARGSLSSNGDIGVGDVQWLGEANCP